MQNVLTSFLGDSNAFYIVAPAGQRCYSSFSSAAQSAADEGSRWNAFHFQTNAGLLQGRSIAGFTLANALAPVPEPQSWVMLILGFGFLGAGMRGRRPRLGCASRRAGFVQRLRDVIAS